MENFIDEIKDLNGSSRYVIVPKKLINNKNWDVGTKLRIQVEEVKDFSKKLLYELTLEERKEKFANLHKTSLHEKIE